MIAKSLFSAAGPVTAAALAALLLAGPAALAAGEDPSPAPKCPSGQIYDEDQQKCVEETSASPQALFDEAVRRARIEKDYQGALDLLWKLDQEDPRVLNYIGYATRKSGDILKGMMYYYKALEKDPDYVLAREYLGEGYVELGRLDLAREQLREIEARCGTDCEAYEDLAAAISAAG